LADTHQLLSSSLQIIDGASGCDDASSAPSVLSSTSGSSSRRQRKDNEVLSAPSADIRALSESLRYATESENNRARLIAEKEDQRLARRRLEQLEDLAREDQRSVRRRLDELEDQAREYRRRYAETDDQDSRKARFYLEEEQRIMLRIASMGESTIATPTRQNTTPRT
jgi:hypothetical protein